MWVEEGVCAMQGQGRGPEEICGEEEEHGQGHLTLPLFLVLGLHGIFLSLFLLVSWVGCFMLVVGCSISFSGMQVSSQWSTPGLLTSVYTEIERERDTLLQAVSSHTFQLCLVIKGLYQSGTALRWLGHFKALFMTSMRGQRGQDAVVGETGFSLNTPEVPSQSDCYPFWSHGSISSNIFPAATPTQCFIMVSPILYLPFWMSYLQFPQQNVGKKELSQFISCTKTSKREIGQREIK